MKPQVVLSGVAKSYGETPAVADLSLEVGDGEIFCLLGPSGCGKSTTLRLIAGLEVPDAGSIEIGGVAVAGEGTWLPPEERRVGIVFQDYALFPHMRVRENIAFGLRGWSRCALRRRVDEVLELVGLSGLEERYPHELSSGQQQRVAIARALAPEPEVVLLDEPFSNLDVDLRRRIRRDIKRILREAGITAIFVTHDQEEAFYIADRLGVMRRGRLEQVG
ncbi:MAG: ABC transporter ATP-binding protein, partial [Euryarchaeota archaeon]|nr:ABC transporter ATP-binding protein [Euryarchaeota archaeon]